MAKFTFNTVFFIITLFCVPFLSFSQNENFNNLSQENQEEIWGSLLASVQSPDPLSSIKESIGNYSLNDIKNNVGNNILHHLIVSDILNENILKILIDLGIDLNSQNSVGYTALTLSIMQNQESYFRWILNQPTTNLEITDTLKRTPLTIASMSNRSFFVKALLAKKVNLEAQDNNGWNPLFYAINNNNVEITTLLIKAGANVNAKSKSFQTPLHLATNNNSSQIVDLLLQNGAIVNSRDKLITAPSTPLDINDSKTIYSLSDSSTKIAQALKDHNAQKANPYFENNVSLLFRYSYGVPFNNVMDNATDPVNAQFVGTQINYHINPSLSLFWAYDYGFGTNKEPYHFVKVPGALAALQQIFSLFSTSYKQELSGPSRNFFYALLGISALLPQGISWDIYPPSLQQWFYFSIVFTFAEANYIIPKTSSNELGTPFLVDVSGLVGAKINFLLDQHSLTSIFVNLGASYEKISFVWNIGITSGYLF